MTPQEKAIELIDKMYLAFLEQSVKQCALIAVDEILKEHRSHYNWCKLQSDDEPITILSKIEEWQEVKQEIENI